MTGVEVFEGGDTTQDIRLKFLSFAGDPDNILYLDFDDQIPGFLKDVSGNYKINEASYIYSSDAHSGPGAGLFNRPENRIVIRSSEELWPGVKPLGDFTISFWLKPAHFSWKNVIFQKQALTDSFKHGLNKGIQIFIQNRRLQFQALNLFSDTQDRRHSIRMVSRTRLQTGNWYHFSLSYRAADGKLIMFINGKEEVVRYAESNSGVWRAGFSRLDRSPLLVAKSYYGLLDEFRISRKAEDKPSAASLYRPLKFDPVRLRGNQPTGTAISPVISLGSNQLSRRARLRFRVQEPGGSAITFFVRYSNKKFRPHTSNALLPWRRTKADNLRGKLLPEFQHFQWKAVFRADPLGKHTPVLKDVRVTYSTYSLPVQPRKPVSILELTHNKQICLEWRLNPELDVRDKKRGGYYIYYGVKPGEYLGKIKYRFSGMDPEVINELSLERLALTREEKRLRNSRRDLLERRLRNKTRLLLSNDLIEKNIVNQARLNTDSRSKDHQLRMPLLRNDRTYYFAISAYYRTRSGKLLESSLSKETSVVLRQTPDRLD